MDIRCARDKPPACRRKVQLLFARAAAGLEVDLKSGSDLADVRGVRQRGCLPRPGCSTIGRSSDAAAADRRIDRPSSPVADGDDQISSLRGHDELEAAPLRDCPFHVFSGRAIRARAGQWLACTRLNGHEHCLRSQDIGWQNRFVFGKGRGVHQKGGAVTTTIRGITTSRRLNQSYPWVYSLRKNSITARSAKFPSYPFRSPI